MAKKKHERSVRATGVGMFLVGLVMVLLSTTSVGLHLLATVTIDMTAPTVVSVNPVCGSPPEPAIVNLGETITLEFKAQDSGTGLEEAWIMIKPDDGEIYALENWLNLGGTAAWMSFSKDFKPTNRGGYAVWFGAIDEAGNTGWKSELIWVPELADPTGNFYINDQLVNNESELSLATNVLNFKFVPTSNVEDIYDIHVKVCKGLQSDVVYKRFFLTSGKSWMASTAPLEEGTYTIEAYIQRVSSGPDIRIASLAVGVGEDVDDPPTPLQFELLILALGIVLMTSGATLAIKPKAIAGRIWG